MTLQALDQYILDAEEAFERNEWLEGRNYLHLALEEEPTFGKAHNHLGWLYLNHLNEYTKAEKHLRLALKYSKGYSAPYVHMIHLLFEAKRFDEHEALLQEAREVAGIDLSLIYNDLGRSNEVHGHFRKAIRYYKTAMRWSLNDQEIITIKDNIRRCRAKRWQLAMIW